MFRAGTLDIAHATATSCCVRKGHVQRLLEASPRTQELNWKVRGTNRAESSSSESGEEPPRLLITSDKGRVVPVQNGVPASTRHTKRSEAASPTCKRRHCGPPKSTAGNVRLDTTGRKHLSTEQRACPLPRHTEQEAERTGYAQMQR